MIDATGCTMSCNFEKYVIALNFTFCVYKCELVNIAVGFVPGK
jgi:hypothetical protein